MTDYMSHIRNILIAQWRTMDNPPKDGQACLISAVDSDCVLMAMYRAGLWFTYDGNPEPVSEVTHWMPLPSPVKAP